MNPCPASALFRRAASQQADWNGLSSEFADAGAFAIPSRSPDAALTLTLPPGNYTVQISGAGKAAGLALVEIYLMPLRPRL